MDCRDRSPVHLLAAGRRDQVHAGSSESELACGGARLLANEPGHAQDDEEEQDRGSEDQNELVGIPPGLPGANSGCDETGAREKRQPERSEARPVLERGLLECPHRGMQGRGAPEQVVDDPADVIAQLVVVGIREERVRVGGVDREKRDDASDQQIEGWGALALVDGETDRRGEEEDVAEGIRGGYGLLEGRQA